jgi:hypothetical protein
MGLERQSATGRFDAHCDECGKILELYAYYPMQAQRLLRLYGWKRSSYMKINGAHGSRLQHYLWRCTAHAPKELAL